MRVSASSYYEWLKPHTSARQVENQKLRKIAKMEYEKSNGTYGRRRLKTAVNESLDLKVSINRIERRMKELKIMGYTPPAFRITTIGDPLLEDSPNLIKDAEANNINEIWVSDITYVNTKEGWLYLCTIMDLCSRKIVGWSMQSNMKVKLVIDAFNSAVKSRKPKGKVIFHSDKGGQYKAKKFRRRLKNAGFEQSMTGVNHCYDNAAAESFFGTLKRELIRGKIFETRQDAEMAIFEYIEKFYNRRRIHSSIGNVSPEKFEEKIA